MNGSISKFLKIFQIFVFDTNFNSIKEYSLMWFYFENIETFKKCLVKYTSVLLNVTCEPRNHIYSNIVGEYLIDVN